MGKPKKGKSNAEDFDDDDFETDQMAAEKEEFPKQPAPAKKDKKKKKGKGKGGDDDEWDDIETKVKDLSLDTNGEYVEDDDSSAPVMAKKKDKKKAKAISGFELLGMDDDVDDDKEDFNDKGSEEENKREVDQGKSKKKEKKKKEKEKPKKAEDEDIDAILADLEKPAAKEKKKGKKKNKQEDDTELADTPMEGTEGSESVLLESKVVTIDDLDAEYEDEKKKKKKKKKQKEEEAPAEQSKQEEGEGEQNEDEDGSTVKTAAQKKKEKKEREKQKKAQEKQKQKKTQASKEDDGGGKDSEEVSKTEDASEKIDDASHEATPEAGEGEEEDAGKDGKKKKKKKKEKGEKEEEKKPTKINKKLAALKEHLQKVQEAEQKAKEEEERLQKEEEERIKRIEEQKLLEEERKRKKKQQKKEREERLKKEGKFLTEKQKQDKRRLEQMLEAMKASGVELPNKEDVPRKRPVYGKKKKPQGQGDLEKSPSPVATSPTEEEASVEIAETNEEEKTKEVAEVTEKSVLEVEDVKDAWDAESEDEEDSKPSVTEAEIKQPVKKPDEEEEESEEEEEEESEEEEEDEEEEEEDEESSEESESESEDDMTPAERGREKIHKRAEKADKLRTLDQLRAPVVCVLGHVDTGKTKILDKLRRTNVQDGEAGGITQQIGATNVPKDAIQDKTKMIKEFAKQELKIPGLLIIDTPGHESFSNLRLRGSSLCDIAILVIDIMHGLEPQTIESINLLKERKTPFVVALNKIDRLYQWKPQPMTDVVNTIKKQHLNTKSEFEERARHVIVQLAEEGLNAALFYENKNPKEYISLIPTSAHSGDGMGNLVALVCDLCQNMLAKRLMYSQELQATVMEVKAITGMGTTIDVILINGSLNESDTIVLAGTEGPIVTQIRGLLMPQPMKELRVKNQYEHHKTVTAAQGVKINAKDMEKALAGLPLYVAHDNDEKEYYRDEVATVLKDTLEAIKVQERGVFVQASTLGSLEALLEFLRTSKIPYAGINIGPVHKKDIMRASVMLEHDSQYAVILAFDVKVEREAQELADTLGVRIFTADIIYHLFDAFTKYRADLKKQKQEEFKNIAVFPCKLRVLPQFIFNSRDPIVMGVSIEAGFVKEGTPVCVPAKEFVDLGRITSIESNHKTVDIARQGQEICIKIVPNPGEAPKMYGRHFDETDTLVSKISRQSIDAVKDHFREEMTKPDWKLMVELKKQFEIL